MPLLDLHMVWLAAAPTSMSCLVLWSDTFDVNAFGSRRRLALQRHETGAGRDETATTGSQKSSSSSSLGYLQRARFGGNAAPSRGSFREVRSESTVPCRYATLWYSSMAWYVSHSAQAVLHPSSLWSVGRYLLPSSCVRVCLQSEIELSPA